jgi:hypothetical protein
MLGSGSSGLFGLAILDTFIESAIGRQNMLPDRDRFYLGLAILKL